ncbi:CopD family protein [Aquirufa antheringensis]|jgi:putative copper export protein|uniref:CopD family protein n=1 Tax=Aquirufa antheringensis TaxID=2516559 RepID=UPI0022A86CF1|nr:CopD family protein [Aquirufa antheringensis]MCZ2486640.1 copper resistance protein CopD [Aquirufa antheringensis]MCZ2488579.1 copper resistance protein CopD [Aquirufa antheringensis]
MLYHTLLLLHLVGACVWVGGHLLLSFQIVPKALFKKDILLIQQFEKTFEPIGIPSLIIQIITGVWMAIFQYGIQFNWDNAIQRNIIIKLSLLVLSLVLALHARIFIIPNLSIEKRPLMVFHIRLITLVALLMVFFGLQFRFGGL